MGRHDTAMVLQSTGPDTAGAPCPARSRPGRRRVIAATILAEMTRIGDNAGGLPSPNSPGPPSAISMTGQTTYPLLDNLNSPDDLRQLPESSLEQVARELRQFLLSSVSRSGGHFAAGLGTVELTVALHYLYDTPHDRIVWDVGHQAYPHKILTGRRDRMHTVRQKGGVSPFPKRDESPYDTFGVGHSSTSISAALGMAIAARARGEQRRAIAVIGRRRAHRGHGVRSVEPRGRSRRGHARHSERQQHVDLAERRRVVEPVRAAPVRQDLQDRARRQQESAVTGTERVGARPARRRARERADRPRHAVRGVRLQLHRPDRRARSARRARDTAQHPEARWSAVPSHHHEEGQGIRSRGRGSREVPRRDAVRSDGGHRVEAVGQQEAELQHDFRRLGVRHGGA